MRSVQIKLGMRGLREKIQKKKTKRLSAFSGTNVVVKEFEWKNIMEDGCSHSDRYYQPLLKSL